MGLTIKKVKKGWVIFSFGRPISAAMPRRKAQRIRRHMAAELAAEA